MSDDFWGAIKPAPDRIRQGRAVRDGYARGWGLQHANLREKILEDPLYREAVPLAKGRSVMAELNRLNLYLIIKYFLHRYSEGHIVEFGAYRGGNALFMARVVHALYPGMKVYALDTYAGMPAPDKSVDAHGRGAFEDTDLEEVRAAARASGLDNIEFVQGLFEETAPQLLANEVRKVSLAHIDCDIHSAVKFSYEVVKPYMVPKGYIVF